MFPTVKPEKIQKFQWRFPDLSLIRILTRESGDFYGITHKLVCRDGEEYFKVQIINSKCCVKPECKILTFKILIFNQTLLKKESLQFELKAILNKSEVFSSIIWHKKESCFQILSEYNFQMNLLYTAIWMCLWHTLINPF